MIRLLGLAGVLFFAQQLHAASVVGSRHDLSSASTPQVCEFCHTPHHASTNLQAPLWNRAETTQTFTLYGSSTLNVTVSQPRAASRLCLSCHDGVNASTMVNGFNVSTKHDLVSPPGAARPDMTTWPNCERCHADFYGGTRKLVIGIDLSNDHPISMPYPTAAQDPAFNTPPDALRGWGGQSQHDVKLYAGGVECGSCHAVHDPGTDGHFLRRPIAGSTLCFTCHKK